MRERVITGLILAVTIFTIILYDNKFLIFTLLGITYVVSVYETAKLIGSKVDIITPILLWIIFYFYNNPLVIFSAIFILYFSYIAYFNKNINNKHIFMFIYPTMPILFLYLLYLTMGNMFLIYIILTVAIVDSSAYFVGKSIGKTKFNTISPKKTLEGVAGGVAIGTIIGSILFSNLDSISNPFILSMMISVSSIFGDLFESYLKRSANVKDSGNILPGHGGILDRIDAHIFASIVAYGMLVA